MLAPPRVAGVRVARTVVARSPGTSDGPNDPGLGATGELGDRSDQRFDPSRCKACFPPLPDPAVSPARAFPGWPDSSARQAGPARARAGRDGLGETYVRTGSHGSAGRPRSLIPWLVLITVTFASVR